MKCGYGKEKITPTPDTDLSGFGFYLDRKATTVLDDLYAYSIVFENNGQKYLLVNCDLLGFTADLLSKTKSLLSRRLLMPAENILVISTHTHTGPATANVVDCGERNDAYLEALSGLIAVSAEKAVEDLREIQTIKTGLEEIFPIGYNRVGSGGMESHLVKTVLIKRANGSPVGIANYGCHPTSLSSASQVSADFPGRFVTAMAKNGVLAAFINAPCGDINPLIQKAGKATDITSDKYDEIITTIDEYGKRLASAFREDTMAETNIYPIQMIGFTLPVQLRGLSYNELETIAADAEVKDNTWPGLSKSTRRYVEQMKMKIPMTKENAFIQVFFLGDIMIIGIPYETFTEIGLMIADAFPNKHVLVAGNANEVLGYLATAKKMEIGGYEAIESTYIYDRLPIETGAGEKLANDIVQTIKEMG